MTDQTVAPTVVLVNGAFADARSWNGVTERLLAAGVKVLAPSIPLRGLVGDSDYIASVLAPVEGPILAVGHSYGGAVIPNAAADIDLVKGLIFVAAFAPEVGESLGEREGDSRDSVLTPALLQRTYPTGTGGETAVELYVDPAKFHEVFSADLPETLSGARAAAQRPVAVSAFDERTRAATCKTRPCGAVVATGDRAAGADVILAMAERAEAELVKLDGSHVIMISQRQAVTGVILQALKAVS